MKSRRPPQLTDHHVMPWQVNRYSGHIDFVLPDDEPDETSADVSASALAFWLWGALIQAVLFFYLGVIYARHFS